MLALLAIVACAHPPPPPVAAPPPAAAPDRPLLLWRVERDGVASHVFGTCPPDLPLDPVLPAPHDALVGAARVVYTEVAYDPARVPEAAPLVVGSGPRLSARLGVERFRALAATQPALPASLVDRLAPWAAATMPWDGMAPGRPEGGAEGFPGPQAILGERAPAAGVPVRGLETLRARAEGLARYGDAFLDGLGSGVLAPERGPDVRTACFRGDAEALVTTLGGFGAVALAERTRRVGVWVPALRPELAEGGAFVAVEATAAVGPGGLLEALRAEGFLVTTLRSTTPVPPVPPPPVAPPPLTFPAGFEAGVALDRASYVEAMCRRKLPRAACAYPDRATCPAAAAADYDACLVQQADAFLDGRPGEVWACAGVGAATAAWLTAGVPEAGGCLRDAPREGPGGARGAR